MNTDNEDYVGYLNNDEVVTCLECGPLECPSKISTEHIFPYTQSCHFCNKVIVKGKSKTWTELFPKNDVVPPTLRDAEDGDINFPLSVSQ